MQAATQPVEQQQVVGASANLGSLNQRRRHAMLVVSVLNCPSLAAACSGCLYIMMKKAIGVVDVEF